MELLVASVQSARGITEAVIKTRSGLRPGHTAVTQLLAALPSLRRLELVSVQPFPLLPPPSHLPQLRELILKDPIYTSPLYTSALGLQDVCVALAPYMQQLTQLHLEHTVTKGTFPHYLRLFGAATASSLATLSLPNCPLTDQLLGLLLEHGPALAHLGVWDVQLTSPANRDRTWGVGTVVVGGFITGRCAYLPTYQAGRMGWRREGGRFLAMECEDAQGFDQALLLRLSEWQFDCPYLHVVPDNRMTASQRIAALPLVLRQLEGYMAAPRPIIQLPGWPNSTVATVLPELSALRLSVGVFQPLTDAVFSQVAQMVPRVCSITAYQYASVFSVPFPWHSLVIDIASTAGLVGLLRMPRPSGAAGLRTIHTQELQISGKLRQSDVDTLRELLPTVQWSTQCNKPSGSFNIVCVASPKAPAVTLCAQLDIARSLRLADCVDRVRVRLYKFDMTHEMLAALHRLPHFADILDFDQCTWPLPVEAYTELAHNVPTSYNVWEDIDCDQAVLESICRGVNERRARLGERPLTVHTVLGGRKTGRMGEHVVVKDGYLSKGYLKVVSQ